MNEITSKTFSQLLAKNTNNKLYADYGNNESAFIEKRKEIFFA